MAHFFPFVLELATNNFDLGCPDTPASLLLFFFGPLKAWLNDRNV
jgi:hypothetical protein